MGWKRRLKEAKFGTNQTEGVKPSYQARETERKEGPIKQEISQPLGEKSETGSMNRRQRRMAMNMEKSTKPGGIKFRHLMLFFAFVAVTFFPWSSYFGADNKLVAKHDVFRRRLVSGLSHFYYDLYLPKWDSHIEPSVVYACSLAARAIVAVVGACAYALDAFLTVVIPATGDALVLLISKSLSLSEHVFGISGPMSVQMLESYNISKFVF